MNKRTVSVRSHDTPASPEPKIVQVEVGPPPDMTPMTVKVKVGPPPDMTPLCALVRHSTDDGQTKGPNKKRKIGADGERKAKKPKALKLVIQDNGGVRLDGDGKQLARVNAHVEALGALLKERKASVGDAAIAAAYVAFLATTQTHCHSNVEDKDTMLRIFDACSGRLYAVGAKGRRARTG